ncbi:MAG TPA: arginine N-succinyltransferase [Kofleriaceae bacterium]|jgi:arginine N-succinyltransferase|nr:arginine N-succinyltransferase [Kofleriaceae bacterium]
MFRIRQSYREDVDQILAVAEYLDTVNLPADRKVIEGIVELSEKSFAETIPPHEREYVFVLEDEAKKKVIGTSMIHAQHGTRRAPHVFYRVENEERYSYTLDRHFVHQVLRIGYNYDGPTEIGGLILLPEYRRNPEALGKALSYVRFLFIRMHRPVFRTRILSELLPPLQTDGTSKLWESLGRHFTGLSYQEADLLSKDNKEFIAALFPDDPIHTELLPADVRAQIGVVGPETKGVEKMLRRIGFEYAGQIDPFDGGPHFIADTDDITIVKDSRQAALTVVEDADGERPWAILAVERAGQKPGFRATGARVIPMEDGSIGVTEETRRRLGVERGEMVWLAIA